MDQFLTIGRNIFQYYYDLFSPNVATYRKIVYTFGLFIIIKTGQELFVIYRRNKRLNRLLQYIETPPYHWLAGHVKHFKDRSKFLDTINKFSKRYNGIYLIKFGPFYHRVFLSNVKYAKEIFSTAEPKEKFVYGSVRHWLGNGLLLSSGKVWRKSRRLLTPAFHFDILKPYVQLFSNCANTLVKKWKNQLDDNAKIDVTEYIHVLTLDTLLNCIFGIESNVQIIGSHPYLTSTQNVLNQVILRFLNPLVNIFPSIYYFTPSGIRHWCDVNKLHSFTRSVIKARLKLLKDNPNYIKSRKCLDFIDILISSKDENGVGFTNKEIQAEVDTFMFEGHDTTANAISFALFNFGQYPQMQEKCRNEINDVLGDSGNDDITWEDIGKFTYLTQFIKESMRLYPVVPSISRELEEDRYVNGIKLEKGTPVSLVIYCIHRDPDVWKDAEIFNPERFEKSNVSSNELDNNNYNDDDDNYDNVVVDNGKPRKKINLDPFSYVPFSAGPRNCIGQNFAMNEMKTILSVILRHFRIKAVDGFEPQVTSQLTLKSINGLWVSIERLN